MNKIIILVCMGASIFFAHGGLWYKSQADRLSRQIAAILIENKRMNAEIIEKQQLYPQPPVTISKAYNLVINDMRYLQENSGTTMNLTIEKSHDNEDISNHYVASCYRKVRKLPVIIQVDKFSGETDMGAVLNDIYQLEADTDFKAWEINKEGNVLIVKGDVYGV